MIRSKQAHYLFMVKSNKKKLIRAIDQCLDLCSEDSRLREFKSYDKGHGREEWRHIQVVPASDLLKKHWPGIRQVGCVHRKRRDLKTGAESNETAYFITSLRNGPKTLLKLNRDHWKIENNLHRTKDTTFKEDASTIHIGNAAHNMATFRNTAVSILENYSDAVSDKIEEFQRFPKRMLKLLALN